MAVKAYVIGNNQTKSIFITIVCNNLFHCFKNFVKIVKTIYAVLIVVKVTVATVIEEVAHSQRHRTKVSEGWDKTLCVSGLISFHSISFSISPAPTPLSICMVLWTWFYWIKSYWQLYLKRMCIASNNVFFLFIHFIFRLWKKIHNVWLAWGYNVQFTPVDAYL